MASGIESREIREDEARIEDNAAKSFSSLIRSPGRPHALHEVLGGPFLLGFPYLSFTREYPIY